MQSNQSSTPSAVQPTTVKNRDYIILRTLPSSIIGVLYLFELILFLYFPQTALPLPTSNLIGLGSTVRLVLGNRSTSTTNLLSLVLGLLHCLTRPLNLGGKSKTDETVLGFELHESILVVVNDAEASGLSTSELGAEAEENDELGVGLVHAAYNFLEFGLGYVGTSRVDDVNNHLLGERGRGGELVIVNILYQIIAIINTRAPPQHNN